MEHTLFFKLRAEINYYKKKKHSISAFLGNSRIERVAQLTIAHKKHAQLFIPALY